MRCFGFLDILNVTLQSQVLFSLFSSEFPPSVLDFRNNCLDKPPQYSVNWAECLASSSGDLKYIVNLHSEHLEENSTFVKISERTIFSLQRSSLEDIVCANLEFWALILSLLFVLDPVKTTKFDILWWIQNKFLSPLAKCYVPRIAPCSGLSLSPETPRPKAETVNKATIPPLPAETVTEDVLLCSHRATCVQDESLHFLKYHSKSIAITRARADCLENLLAGKLPFNELEQWNM